MKMNFQQVIIIVALSLVLSASGSSRRHEFKKGMPKELSRRQVPEACEDCPLKLDIKDLILTVTKLGPALNEALKTAGLVVDDIVRGLQNLEGALLKTLITLKDKLPAVLDALSVALRELIDCDQVDELFDNLDINTQALLKALIEDYKPLMAAQQAGTLLVQVGKTVIKLEPITTELLQDLLINGLELASLCAALRGVIDLVPAIVKILLKLVGQLLIKLFGGPLSGLLAGAGVSQLGLLTELVNAIIALLKKLLAPTTSAGRSLH